MSARYFKVFNLDCVEGVEDKHNIKEVIKGSVFEPIENADSIYTNMRKKPTLEHRDNAGCFYRPSQHLINMSSPETFASQMIIIRFYIMKWYTQQGIKIC